MSVKYVPGSVITWSKVGNHCSGLSVEREPIFPRGPVGTVQGCNLNIYFSCGAIFIALQKNGLLVC